LHYTCSNAKGGNAPNTINNIITHMKHQSSIITIPELGMPWLAIGAPGRGGRIGWLGR
jgi:hypothetical protein